MAGHGGYSDESGMTYPGDFDAQVRICFERIRAVLAKAGGTLDDIVSMTVFIVDMNNGDRFTEVRRSFSPKAVILAALSNRNQGACAPRDDAGNPKRSPSSIDAERWRACLAPAVVLFQIAAFLN